MVNFKCASSLAFELVHEFRSFAQPFEPLLGGQAVKFAMVAKILVRSGQAQVRISLDVDHAQNHHESL